VSPDTVLGVVVEATVPVLETSVPDVVAVTVVSLEGGVVAGGDAAGFRSAGGVGALVLVVPDVSEAATSAWCP
jgi:hypothetical protein